MMRDCGQDCVTQSIMNILEKDGIMIQNHRKLRKKLYQISNRDFSFLVVQELDYSETL